MRSALAKAGNTLYHPGLLASIQTSGIPSSDAHQLEILPTAYPPMAAKCIVSRGTSCYPRREILAELLKLPPHARAGPQRRRPGRAGRREGCRRAAHPELGPQAAQRSIRRDGGEDFYPLLRRPPRGPPEGPGRPSLDGPNCRSGKVSCMVRPGRTVTIHSGYFRGARRRGAQTAHWTAFISSFHVL
jgi:hypothetical protein